MKLLRILVAVDDSPAAVAAARTALDLAADHGGALRVVTVVHDHLLARALDDGAAAERRLVTAGQAVLGWLADLASSRGVPCDVVLRDGEPFRQIIDEAEAWDADLIVIGRSDSRGPSPAYLGSETAHVLEFARQPVLVVPTSPPSPGSPSTE